MTCAKCESGGECDCGGDNKACKGDDSNSNHRLKALRLCEPFCDNGGCAPPTRADAGTAAAQSEVTLALRAAVASMVKEGKATLSTDGKSVMFAGSTVWVTLAALLASVTSSGDCCKFGPHFNNERRAGTLSPTDVEAISLVYKYEESVDNIAGVFPANTDWHYTYEFALGVSHKVCIESIIAYTVDPGTGAKTFFNISAVALGGVLVACGDGSDFADEGSYVRVLSTPTQADPESITRTEYRCACADLCRYITARGQEVLYVKVPDLPDGATLHLDYELRRCEWLYVPPQHECVAAIGNQIVVADGNLLGLYPDSLRATPGSVPFLV